MGPRTRSQVEAPSGNEQLEQRGMSGAEDVEMHISRAVEGVKILRRELEVLRKRNTELERRLANIEQADDASLQPKRGQRGSPTVAKLQAEARRLKSRIRELEKARHKDRKRIEKLRLREIKADAVELQDATEFEVGDSAYHMRKVWELLRQFHDIMVATSIEEGEECPICIEPLQLNKCASLLCEHTFCEFCITQVGKGEEVISCPQCRAQCPRDEIEVVQYTASQQWDALLEVAKRWVKMDTRRQEDTSEEEAEEEFIDDEQSNTPESSSRSASANPLASSPELEDGTNSDVLPVAAAPTTTVAKRKIAFSPESSPLTPLNGDAQAGDASDTTAAEILDQLEQGSSGGPGGNAVEAATQPHAPGQNTVAEPSTPTYSQSPASEKRKRLEALAVTRNKRKRL